MSFEIFKNRLYYFLMISSRFFPILIYSLFLHFKTEFSTLINWNIWKAHPAVMAVVFPTSQRQVLLQKSVRQWTEQQRFYSFYWLPVITIHSLPTSKGEYRDFHESFISFIKGNWLARYSTLLRGSCIWSYFCTQNWQFLMMVDEYRNKKCIFSIM